MKYNHAVKHNGIFYPAGTDVPVKGPSEKESNSVPEDDSDSSPSGKEEGSKKSGK